MIADCEVAALEAQRQIAKCRRLGKHSMDIDRQLLAEHAIGRDDTAGLVEMELCGSGVKDNTRSRPDLGKCGTGRRVDVGLRDLARLEFDRGRVDNALRPATRDIDID
jgi:hypothetical protein